MNKKALVAMLYFYFVIGLVAQSWLLHKLITGG